MSSSKYINIGTYLKVKTKEVEVNEPFLTCLNKDCENNTKKITGTFCRECGSENKFVDNIVKSKFGIDKLLVDFGGWDFLYPVTYMSEYSIYALNRNSKSLHIDGEDNENEYNIPDKEESLDNFNTQCHDFLECLNNNDFEYEVKFGVVTYWN